MRQEELRWGLEALKNAQLPPLQRLGHDNHEKETLAVYAAALSIEVSEFVNELPWKPWKHKEPNLADVVEEFADILHFLGSWLNILQTYGISTADIAAAFAQKHEVNAKRFNGEVKHYGAPPLLHSQKVPDGWQQRRIDEDGPE